jgi:hypothetical protein
LTFVELETKTIPSHKIREIIEEKLKEKGWQPFSNVL